MHLCIRFEYYVHVISVSGSSSSCFLCKCFMYAILYVSSSADNARCLAAPVEFTLIEYNGMTVDDTGTRSIVQLHTKRDEHIKHLAIETHTRYP